MATAAALAAVEAAAQVRPRFGISRAENAVQAVLVGAAGQGTAAGAPAAVRDALERLQSTAALGRLASAGAVRALEKAAATLRRGGDLNDALAVQVHAGLESGGNLAGAAGRAASLLNRSASGRLLGGNAPAVDGQPGSRPTSASRGRTPPPPPLPGGIDDDDDDDMTPPPAIALPPSVPSSLAVVHGGGALTALAAVELRAAADSLAAALTRAGTTAASGALDHAGSDPQTAVNALGALVFASGGGGDTTAGWATVETVLASHAGDILQAAGVETDGVAEPPPPAMTALPPASIPPLPPTPMAPSPLVLPAPREGGPSRPPRPPSGASNRVAPSPPPPPLLTPPSPLPPLLAPLPPPLPSLEVITPLVATLGEAAGRARAVVAAIDPGAAAGHRAAGSYQRAAAAAVVTSTAVLPDPGVGVAAVVARMTALASLPHAFHASSAAAAAETATALGRMPCRHGVYDEGSRVVVEVAAAVARTSVVLAAALGAASHAAESMGATLTTGEAAVTAAAAAAPALMCLHAGDAAGTVIAQGIGRALRAAASAAVASSTTTVITVPDAHPHASYWGGGGRCDDGDAVVSSCAALGVLSRAGDAGRATILAALAGGHPAASIVTAVASITQSCRVVCMSVAGGLTAQLGGPLLAETDAVTWTSHRGPECGSGVGTSARGLRRAWSAWLTMPPPAFAALPPCTRAVLMAAAAADIGCAHAAAVTAAPPPWHKWRHRWAADVLHVAATTADVMGKLEQGMCGGVLGPGGTCAACGILPTPPVAASIARAVAVLKPMCLKAALLIAPAAHIIDLLDRGVGGAGGELGGQGEHPGSWAWLPHAARRPWPTAPWDVVVTAAADDPGEAYGAAALATMLEGETAVVEAHLLAAVADRSELIDADITPRTEMESAERDALRAAYRRHRPLLEHLSALNV